jgi:microcompartment protein CcmL/EutN
MSKGNALGFIESVGLASAIAAADAALKAANVELIGREISKGNGMVTVKVAGEVGAVNAAISAAKAVSAKVSRVWSTDVIPRPAKDLGSSVVWNRDTMGADEWLTSCGPTVSAYLPETRKDAPLANLPPKGEIVAVPETASAPDVIEEDVRTQSDAPRTQQEGTPPSSAPAEKSASDIKRNQPRRKSGGSGKKPK